MLILNKRIDHDDDKKVSSTIKEEQTTSNNAHMKWIMCSSNEQTQSTIGYNCEGRPYMTVLLIVTILIFITLRKSTYIKNWIASHQEKLREQAAEEEEEGLMQRVF